MDVDFKNINDFIQKYPIKSTTCQHEFPINFVELGVMTDESILYLSYQQYFSEKKNEIYIGSYPYNSAKLWKCKDCGSLKFSYNDDSGWGRLVEVEVNFDKNYKINPASKSVKINTKDLNIFVEKFGFTVLLFPELIADKLVNKIVSENKTYIFSYRTIKENEETFIRFEIIADRNLLLEITKFEKSKN